MEDQEAKVEINLGDIQEVESELRLLGIQIIDDFAKNYNELENFSEWIVCFRAAIFLLCLGEDFKIQDLFSTSIFVNSPVVAGVWVTENNFLRDFWLLIDHIKGSHIVANFPESLQNSLIESEDSRVREGMLMFADKRNFRLQITSILLKLLSESCGVIGNIGFIFSPAASKSFYLSFLVASLELLAASNIPHVFLRTRSSVGDSYLPIPSPRQAESSSGSYGYIAKLRDMISLSNCKAIGSGLIDVAVSPRITLTVCEAFMGYFIYDAFNDNAAIEEAPLRPLTGYAIMIGSVGAQLAYQRRNQIKDVITRCLCGLNTIRADEHVGLNRIGEGLGSERETDLLYVRGLLDLRKNNWENFEDWIICIGYAVFLYCGYRNRYFAPVLFNNLLGIAGGVSCFNVKSLFWGIRALCDHVKNSHIVANLPEGLQSSLIGCEDSRVREDMLMLADKRNFRLQITSILFRLMSASCGAIGNIGFIASPMASRSFYLPFLAASLELLAASNIPHAFLRTRSSASDSPRQVESLSGSDGYMAKLWDMISLSNCKAIGSGLIDVVVSPRTTLTVCEAFMGYFMYDAFNDNAVLEEAPLRPLIGCAIMVGSVGAQLAYQRRNQIKNVITRCCSFFYYNSDTASLNSSSEPAEEVYSDTQVLVS